VELELRFVPSALIRHWCDDLANLHLRPTEVVLGPREELRASLADDSEPGRRSPSLRSIAGLLFVAAAIVFVIVDWRLALERRDRLSEQVAGEQAQLAKQRVIERKTTELLAVLAETSKEDRVTASHFLALLATALPETDWLTEVSF